MQNKDYKVILPFLKSKAKKYYSDFNNNDLIQISQTINQKKYIKELVLNFK